ncbi:MAG: HEPN family nuclease [Planctomycetota bacterium]|jgi:hypothetical protein
MDYPKAFYRSFLARTLEQVRSRSGSADPADLLNCLLGLLVVPREASFARIPEEPLSNLREWGISRKSIKNLGTCPCGNGHPRTLRQLVGSLRSAVAHFDVKPQQTNGTCTGFEFCDGSGFHAVIKTTELRTFVERLAEQLEPEISGRGDPRKTKYVASRQQDPFHIRSCKWAKRISPANLQGVRTRRAAVGAGHRPCKVCKP